MSHAKLTKGIPNRRIECLVELVRADHTNLAFRADAAAPKSTHVVDAGLPTRRVVFHVTAHEHMVEVGLLCPHRVLKVVLLKHEAALQLIMDE